MNVTTSLEREPTVSARGSVGVSREVWTLKCEHERVVCVSTSAGVSMSDHERESSVSVSASAVSVGARAVWA